MKTDYKPKLLFIEITPECNLRCKQCFMWQLNDNENRLKERDYIQLIDEFHGINKNGAVILTGGEIFLKSSLVFSILRKSNSLGIDTVINTNGTLIPSDKQFELVINGPQKLVFSLDSHKRELHDHIRGIKGTFDNAVSTIRCLIAIKNNNKLCNKKIYISTILHKENINEIDSMISFAKSLKVDGIVFQALTPTLYGSKKVKKDMFFNKFFFKKVDNALNKIDKLIETSVKDDFILNTYFDLTNIKKYISSPYFTDNIICKAHENNLVVNHTGDIKYCYNMEAIFPEQISNIRFNKISDIIYSKKSREARERMKTCNMSCGILNCNK